jgi:hypothetical protein
VFALSNLLKLYELYAFDVSSVLTCSGPGRCWNTKPGPDRDGASAMTDPTDRMVSRPESENQEPLVRIDLGGWISGPCMRLEPAPSPEGALLPPNDGLLDDLQGPE